MNLFDIWFISIVLSISANIILVVLLMTKISEINEMRSTKWK
jgi:hypothetical protein|tara:strand:- start:721 stop:846 length:126 start_codon:yes stop_codon:yes gene_type:complete